MSTAEGKQQLHTQDPVSRPLTFKVTRSAETDYPKPSVLQATDDRLDPIDALNGATVRAQYPAMLPSDILAVDWSGSTAADSWQSDQQPGSLFGYVDFQAPVSVVAASQGKTVTLRYAVIRIGEAPKLSLPLLLAVGTLAQTHLPAPVIPQANATTKVLDLNNFTGNAQVKVEPWPLIAVGQRVWVRLDGTLENGSPHTFYLARGVEVIADQVTAGLDLVLQRSELEALRHGSSLTVTVSVTFDGTNDEEQARVFPGAPYTLNPATPLTIDTSPATLKGSIIRNSNPVTNPPPNAFVQRTATGGKPPYTYSTSNGNVVEVDASTGRAVSFGSGTANVIVTDTVGARASYPVTVSNVRLVEGLGMFNVWVSCRHEAARRAGTLPTLAEWDAMRACYNNNPGLNDRAWSEDSAGEDRRYAIDIANGNRVSLRATNISGDSAVGWGIFSR